MMRSFIFSDISKCRHATSVAYGSCRAWRGRSPLCIAQVHATMSSVATPGDWQPTYDKQTKCCSTQWRMSWTLYELPADGCRLLKNGVTRDTCLIAQKSVILGHLFANLETGSTAANPAQANWCKLSRAETAEKNALIYLKVSIQIRV